MAVPAPSLPDGKRGEQISGIDSRRLIFLDENGVTVEMTSRYCRAPTR